MALVDTEQITPLEEISKLYSSEASIIEKISKKWSDRTKNDANPWPKNGSWDLKLILQIFASLLVYFLSNVSRDRDKRLDVSRGTGECSVGENPIVFQNKTPFRL